MRKVVVIVYNKIKSSLNHSINRNFVKCNFSVERQVAKDVRNKVIHNNVMMLNSNKGLSIVVLYMRTHKGKVSDFISEKGVGKLKKDPPNNKIF